MYFSLAFLSFACIKYGTFSHVDVDRRKINSFPSATLIFLSKKNHHLTIKIKHNNKGQNKQKKLKIMNHIRRNGQTTE